MANTAAKKITYDGKPVQVESAIRDGSGKVISSTYAPKFTVTDSNPTLAWGTKSKVATVAGTAINVTMPANPTTGLVTGVSSVNTKTGAVTLSASDVGALPSSTKYAGSSSAGGAATTALACTGNSATATLATKAKGLIYIVGTGTVAGTWLGSSDDITAYYDGLSISYYINIAGASTTTLNINGLGPKTVRRNNANLTTHLPVGTVVILTYTTIDNVGYWVWADYDYNTNNNVLQRLQSGAYNLPLLMAWNVTGTTGDKTAGSYKNDGLFGRTNVQTVTAVGGFSSDSTWTAAAVKLLPQATGFKASGGTTSKTLTLDADLTTSAVVTTSSPAANGGATLSLVTTGEKYTWNNKIGSHQTIKQDGVTGATANRYASCTTGASTAAKAATITTGTFTLEAGARVTVKFANQNTANSPTLNINSTGARNIFRNGAQITSGTNKGMLYGVCDFVYDGTQWLLTSSYMQDYSDVANRTLTLVSSSNTDVSGFPYKYSFAVTGATTSHVPTVTFSMAELNKNVWAPIASTGSNVIYVYAKSSQTTSNRQIGYVLN